MQHLFNGCIFGHTSTTSVTFYQNQYEYYGSAADAIGAAAATCGW